MANHLLITISGFFLDVALSMNLALGIGLSTLGIIIYTLAKMLKKPDEETEEILPKVIE